VRRAEAEQKAAMVFSTHCDQLRRAFDTIAERLGNRVFLFNVPATCNTEAAGKIFRSELERLGEFLIALGGSAPGAPQLTDCIEQRQNARIRLTEAAGWCPARPYAEALIRFHWDGTVHLPEPLKSSPTGVPVALIGGPFLPMDFGLFDCIERAGARVVLNATEGGERSLLQQPACPQQHWEDAQRRATVGSGPDSERAADWSGRALDMLVQRYLQGSIDVFHRPNTRLYKWLRRRIEARKVRGLILWHYVGCDLWCAEAQSLREAFKLPLVVLEPEEGTGSFTRLTNRIEAFIESLR